MDSTTKNNTSRAGPSSEVKDSKQHAYVVAGGYNNNTTEVFDKTSKSWIESKPMKMCRVYASSIVYNGHVLVTGGTSNSVESSTEQFSLNASPHVPPSWSYHAVKLPRPLKGHCACTVLYKGHLIVLGGDNGNDDSDLIYAIQLQFPFTAKILARSLSARPVGGCGAVLVNDQILIFGGGKGSEPATANVTMYDITKNEFKEIEPLPYGVCNMATVKYGENVVLVGGSS